MKSLELKLVKETMSSTQKADVNSAGSNPAGPATMHTKSQLPSSISHSEQWYFRIDGHEFGPTTREKLERFLQPPRLCPSLEVMCSTKMGTWFLVSREESIDAVLMHAGVLLAPTAPSPPHSVPAPPHEMELSWISKRLEWGRRKIGFVIYGIKQYRELSLGVLVVVAINVVGLYLSASPHARDHQIFLQLQSLWDKARSFDNENTKSDEWQRFAVEANKIMEPIINELSKDANRDRPIKQDFLFVCRDHLKPLLDAQFPPRRDSNQAMFAERYLRVIRKQLPTE